MPSLFQPLDRLSSWRRIASAMWKEHNSPQVLGFDDIDMSELNQLIQEGRELTGERLTLTHFVILATALVFEKYPDLNVVMVRGKPMRRKDINIFVQVAITGSGEASGADLSGVQIKNANTKTVLEIAQEINKRANRVRTGKDKDIEQTKRMLDIIPGSIMGSALGILTKLLFDAELNMTSIGVKPDPFGSAMVTNCAGFDVHAGFAPLIPAARTPVIFLLGRTEDKPVVRDKEIVIRPIMRACATFDHRLLDGYQIGLICSAFKNTLRHPDELRRRLM